MDLDSVMIVNIGLKAIHVNDVDPVVLAMLHPSKRSVDRASVMVMEMRLKVFVKFNPANAIANIILRVTIAKDAVQITMEIQ